MDTFNIIIVAVAFLTLLVAFATFISSISYNRKVLHQAETLSTDTLNEIKVLYKDLVNAQLFNNRYEVIEYFHSILHGDFKKPDNFDDDEFLLNHWKMYALFDDYQDMIEASVALSNFYNGHELPDFTARSNVTSASNEELLIKSAFINFYNNSIKKLEKQLGVKDK